MSSEAQHSWSATAIDDAQRAEYVGFLHRGPFVADAYRFGFTVGVREDYTFRSSLRNIDVPLEILDNDFRNPDLDRYIGRFERYTPSIGILGDAYDVEEAREYNRAARELKSRFPDTEFIIVPKSREAIGAVDEDTILGYPMGYSDKTAEEYTNIVDWRRRRVHLVSIFVFFYLGYIALGLSLLGVLMLVLPPVFGLTAYVSTVLRAVGKLVQASK